MTNRQTKEPGDLILKIENRKIGDASLLVRKKMGSGGFFNELYEFF